MLANQIETITEFLINNKNLIKNHGLEREAGIYKHFWAKYCNGFTDPNKAEQKATGPHVERTYKILMQLRKDLDKVLATH